MHKFTTLEPVRLHGQRTSVVPTKRPAAPPSLVGRLPTDLHLLVLSHLPIPDFPAYSRCARATAALADDPHLWESRCAALGFDDDANVVLDHLDARVRAQAAAARAAAPPTIAVEDDFGDFAAVDTLAAPPAELADFVGAFDVLAIPVPPPVSPRPSYKATYIRAHTLLKPLTAHLSSSPHAVLTALAAATAGATSTLRQKATSLRMLASFLSPIIQPVRAWKSLHAFLRAAIDRFDANLLAAFDAADGTSDEAGMRDAAAASWDVWDRTGDWEMGKVWADKREIFYEQGRWDPLANVTAAGALDFDAMDEFISHVVAAITEHGARAVRVFPPESRVLIAFADRIAAEVMGEYIAALLERARTISTDTYLKAAAAAFRESWRIVDAVIAAADARSDAPLPRTSAEDVLYQMFEQYMDEYLDDELDAARRALDAVCAAWDAQASISASASQPRFLSAQSPAAVKRTVLASFTHALLLPVTIVPRTVGAALTTGGAAAVQGLAMLNPQRWGGSGVVSTNAGAGVGYARAEEPDAVQNEELEVSPPPTAASDSTTLVAVDGSAPPKLELLLSLDVALELIHADREALKRVETFAGYPGHYGRRVRDTIEELSILLLQALGTGHIEPGFARATEQMTVYEPKAQDAEHGVAPLLQFFELVHVGDTVAAMVQVYFDKELAPHIDRTDFMNPVVREKKRFENALDDAVAGGLNAGTQVLMNQVEHIILEETRPGEYCPPEDAPLELGPTRGCTDAIECLSMHCRLLRGSTSKEVLEVFYQEVGLRLIAILQKHLKRQIISLRGGFQVIADLNAYYTFIASLRVPTLAADFAHLKMLGHVFVVEDARDLAQIVRDVTRYGGAYRPEDIYEFVQRRADWKKIEKTVDKTMYNLSFKEDCVMC